MTSTAGEEMKLRLRGDLKAAMKEKRGGDFPGLAPLRSFREL